MKATVSQNKHFLSSSKSPRFELTIAKNIYSLTADAFTFKSERDIPFKKSKGVWKDQSPLKKTKGRSGIRTGKERLYDYPGKALFYMAVPCTRSLLGALRDDPKNGYVKGKIP